MQPPTSQRPHLSLTVTLFSKLTNNRAAGALRPRVGRYRVLRKTMSVIYIYTVYCGSLRPDLKIHFHRIFLKLFLHHDIVEFDRFRTSFSAYLADLGYIEGAELSFRHDFWIQIWFLAGNFGLGNKEVRALRPSTQSFL